MKYLKLKRETFYYFIVTDLNKIRDDKLSILFDEEKQPTYFLSECMNRKFTITEDIYMARFWKDKSAALKFGNDLSNNLNDRSIVLNLQTINRKEFIKKIPDLEDSDDASSSYIYKRNIKYKKAEMDYLNELNEFMRHYKAISAYEPIADPTKWFNCPKCDLKPIIWTFNNGRSTACGCGENEYRHHSISAESIMSHVTRNGGSAIGYDTDELRKNWNHWCKTGEILFNPNLERW